MAEAANAVVSSLTGVVISEGRLRAACALRVNKTAVLEDYEHQSIKTKCKKKERRWLIDQRKIIIEIVTVTKNLF